MSDDSDTWRAYSNRHLAGVFRQAREDGVTDEKEIRRRIFAAYPYGMRKYWPYKVWLQQARKWIAAWKVGFMAPMEPPPHKKQRVGKDNLDLGL